MVVECATASVAGGVFVAAQDAVVKDVVFVSKRLKVWIEAHPSSKIPFDRENYAQQRYQLTCSPSRRSLASPLQVHVVVAKGCR